MRGVAALLAVLALLIVPWWVSGQATEAPSTPAPAASTAPDPWAPYEHWVTGDIFIEQSALMFRTDKPVEGNSRKNVVMLGVTRAAGKVLLPIYLRVAELHQKVRLFGAFLPYSGKIACHPGPLPNVEFMTWKVHSPSDPDVLPPGQRIDIDGGVTTIGNVPVQLTNPDGSALGSNDKIEIHHANGQLSGSNGPPSP
jgi:hypothetical protein